MPTDRSWPRLLVVLSLVATGCGGSGSGTSLPREGGGGDLAVGREATPSPDGARLPDGGRPADSRTDRARVAPEASTCAPGCTGSCVAGECLVTLATKQGAPWGLAVDSLNVYWTNNGGGGLRSVALSGGSVVQLATGGSLVGLAVTAAYLFWADDSTGSLMQASLCGGSAAAAASCQSSPWAVAADATNAYWTNLGSGTGNGTVMQVSMLGGTPKTLASGLLGVGGVAVDARYVYFTDLSGVERVPIGGGSPTTMAPGNGANDVVVDATSIYWVNEAASPGAGSVQKMPIGGGSSVTLASGQDFPYALAVDGKNVYWTNSGACAGIGSVAKVPLGGGSVVTLASSQDTPRGIAVDATSVYWADYGSGNIMSASPK